MADIYFEDDGKAKFLTRYHGEVTLSKKKWEEICEQPERDYYHLNGDKVRRTTPMPEPMAGTEMTERYDQESDVYYFTFKTGEPSYCVEVNDTLLLEIGMFSHLPTGFRILNMSKSVTKRITIGEAKKFLGDVLRNLSVPNRTDRELSVERALEKVLA